MKTAMLTTTMTMAINLETNTSIPTTVTAMRQWRQLGINQRCIKQTKRRKEKKEKKTQALLHIVKDDSLIEMWSKRQTVLIDKVGNIQPRVPDGSQRGETTIEVRTSNEALWCKVSPCPSTFTLDPEGKATVRSRTALKEVSSSHAMPDRSHFDSF